MALNNHSNLVASVIKWAHRSDISPLVPDFIALAEAEMYGMLGRLPDGTNIKPLRLRSMETRTTVNAGTGSRFLALPERFLEMRQLGIAEAAGQIRDVIFKTPEQMAVRDISGRPLEFTITSQIEFDRIPDATYDVTIAYYAKAVPLTADDPVNTILTDHPNIYLFGALWALFLYAADEEKSEFYWVRFAKAIQSANKADRSGRYGPGAVMAVEGYTP